MNYNLFFLLLRFSIAASMLGHGLARLPKLRAFSKGMAMKFEKSGLPKNWVLGFSYALPFIEFAIGFLLFTGLLTQAAAMAGGLLMIVLILGTAMIETWDAIPSQLLHAAFFSLLLYFIQYNTLAIDNLINELPR